MLKVTVLFRPFIIHCILPCCIPDSCSNLYCDISFSRSRLEIRFAIALLTVKLIPPIRRFNSVDLPTYILYQQMKKNIRRYTYIYLTFWKSSSIICRYTCIKRNLRMIIAFCGHAQFCGSYKYEQRILDFLEEHVGERAADMYLGGYGGFDAFAYECCKKYKETHPNTSLVFVTPYLTFDYQRNHLKDQTMRYDSIIYPEIEDKPKRYAITYRNKYMVENADFVVAYVSHNWGGAYATYKHAKRKGKYIFNLAVFE